MKPIGRRDFVCGLAAGSALAAVPWVRSAFAPTDGQAGNFLEARAGVAMNTVIEVVAAGNRKEKLAAACEAALVACREVDAGMNFYDPRSELSKINLRAGQGPVEISPGLMAVLLEARRVHETSSGAFDPAVGASVLLFREARRKGVWPSAEEIAQQGNGAGFSEVFLNEASRTVRFGNRKIRIDLGGIAKGYAVDLAVSRMKEAGAQAGVVNAGGDLFVFGSGELAKDISQTGIEDPFSPGVIRHRLSLLEESLATSGDSEQGVLIQGRPCSHLIDPSTGVPVQAAVGSASVRAASAMTADAWASALYVRPALAASAPVESLVIAGPASEVSTKGFFAAIPKAG